jgi:hypothetical protein
VCRPLLRGWREGAWGGGGGPRTRLQVSDMGCSRQTRTLRATLAASDGPVAVAGNDHYRAPEGGQASGKVDVYAVGVMACEVALRYLKVPDRPPCMVQYTAAMRERLVSGARVTPVVGLLGCRAALRARLPPPHTCVWSTVGHACCRGAFACLQRQVCVSGCPVGFGWAPPPPTPFSYAWLCGCPSLSWFAVGVQCAVFAAPVFFLSPIPWASGCH